MYIHTYTSNTTLEKTWLGHVGVDSRGMETSPATKNWHVSRINVFVGGSEDKRPQIQISLSKHLSMNSASNARIQKLIN